jgi:hypothetical protein
VNQFTGASSICAADLALAQSIRRAALCEVSPSEGCCSVTPALGWDAHAPGQEDAIQRIGGWKTASMFKRYNVIDERDLADAGERYLPA